MLREICLLARVAAVAKYLPSPSLSVGSVQGPAPTLTVPSPRALPPCAHRQDPYCIVRVGAQMFRTRTARDGGRNPVWNETFDFNLINENDVELEIKVRGRGGPAPLPLNTTANHSTVPKAGGESNVAWGMRSSGPSWHEGSGM